MRVPHPQWMGNALLKNKEKKKKKKKTYASVLSPIGNSTSKMDCRIQNHDLVFHNWGLLIYG